MLDKHVEENLLLAMVSKLVPVHLAGVRTIVDKGDSHSRDCEWFELFFAIDENCGIELDPDTADGSQVIYELAKSATDLIIERYAEKSGEMPEKIVCIGICLDSEWLFGKDEVPEIEAMVGSLHESNAIIGCWRFAVRFVKEPTQIEGRCLSAQPRDDFMDSWEDGPAAPPFI